MASAPDILKIQRSVRKSVKDYSIAGNHEEEALIILLSMNVYLALDEKEAPAPPKRNKSPEVINLGKAAECN
jgi:hypothetical protein